jgi:hypothetical protein
VYVYVCVNVVFVGVCVLCVCVCVCEWVCVYVCAHLHVAPPGLLILFVTIINKAIIRGERGAQAHSRHLYLGVCLFVYI